jgi:alpha-amylase
VHRVSGNGETVNLFMDYETFGEHQWESTGIFDFLRHMPGEVLKHPDWNFKTPSEVADAYPKVAEMPFRRTTSWADLERDTTAWTGNRMQTKALPAAYALKELVYASGSEDALHAWRKLLTSDHYYYMCTKWFADGDVHAYFSPYESPYDAFINFKNVLKDFSRDLQPEPAAFEDVPALPAAV